MICDQGVRFIFAEPWATRVPQRETDRAVAKAANEGVQLFFKKVCYLLYFTSCIELR